MPWKESYLVNERMRFICRLEDGECMSQLCEEFGISRKTGYKFLERFRRYGPDGLFDQSRRPYHSPNRTSMEVRQAIVALKHKKPFWGATKIRSRLRKLHPKLAIPSRFTVHEILHRYDLVETRRSKRRPESYLQTPLVASMAPNEIWCVDFKGQFRMGNSQYCYPLTITDHFSRFLISCEGLETTHGEGSQGVFEAAFREYGLPGAIRSDNGAPFASTGLFGFSRLSVWWMTLGIQLQRIEPGHPEQNGRHERMHLTLKNETTRPAAANLLQQQEKFDSFKDEFNQERPHESLDLETPATLYCPSSKAFSDDIPKPEYPNHDLVRNVSINGSVSLKTGTKFFLSESMAYQQIGLREEDPDLWRVSFLNYDLGFFDAVERKFKRFDQPQLSGDL